MKRAVGIGMVSTMMLFLLASCGVSAEEYSNVSTKLATAQDDIRMLQDRLSTKDSALSASKGELRSVQSQLEASEDELRSVQSQLEASEDELRSVQSQLEASEDELQSVQSQLEASAEKIEQIKIRMEVINGVWVPIFRGESPGGVSYFFEWRDQVIAIGDPMLTEKLNKVLDEGTDEATAEFFIYLFESTAEILKPVTKGV